MTATLGSSFQTLSLLSLTGLILIEWVALRSMLRETLVLKHLYEPSAAAATAEDALLGTKPRPFRAVHLDSPAALTDMDLMGRVTTFLFVQPTEVLSQRNSLFSSVLHSLWQRRRGPLYVVCSGPRPDCQLLRDRYRLEQAPGNEFGVLFDETATLRRNFSITAALYAVVIGEDGRVAKVGGVESINQEPAGALS